ncbi:hypothetical protein [Neobacillus mesonae]|nr:hypothetical protein [Neobacillus mesonae]MCM3569496.1 hypothetical protein [Neobacillus mesonae]
MKKLLICGLGLIVVGTLALSTNVGGSGEANAKDNSDLVPQMSKLLII